MNNDLTKMQQTQQQKYDSNTAAYQHKYGGSALRQDLKTATKPRAATQTVTDVQQACATQLSDPLDLRESLYRMRAYEFINRRPHR